MANRDGQQFLSAARRKLAERGKVPARMTYPVPASPKPKARVEERANKRALKAGLVAPNRPRPPRDMAIGRGEQQGHRPSRRFAPRKQIYRNSIWPEGRTAKPGRMG